MEPLWWAAVLLGKENFLGLPDCREALPSGDHMEQGVLASSVTSGKSPNLSGPQYNWESDLHDLSLRALTSCCVLLAKPFHGNDFDLFNVIVALTVACCLYGAHPVRSL